RKQRKFQKNIHPITVQPDPVFPSDACLPFQNSQTPNSRQFQRQKLINQSVYKAAIQGSIFHSFFLGIFDSFSLFGV
ncbi:MAG: hypothetical protein Q4C59_13905, partial [Lachnospiraceae bacterium]|nr:hypothetical protein [Lachnospiraceae bacterium]